MLKNIKYFNLLQISDNRGDMFILENKNLKMNFMRTFLVYGDKNTHRGRHAHKQCSQLLIAINGKIEVVCKDAQNHKSFILENPKEALLVPPKVWSEQIYKENGSILGVWCDEPYREDDYIRDWNEFLLEEIS